MTAHSMISRMMALALAGSVLAGSNLPGPVLAATKKAATPAAPAEPSLTREDARKHAADIFDKLDFNHDGVIDAADGKARHEAHLGAMFDRIDTNHDGAISKAEFLAAHEGPMRRPMDGPGASRDEADRMAFSPMVFAILRTADPQHTGSVTKEAFIAAELKRFDETDANHDGKVTREEMHAARHDHRGWEHHGWGERRWEGRPGGPMRHDGPHDGGPDAPPPPPSA